MEHEHKEMVRYESDSPLTNIFPTYPAKGEIFSGYDSLAKRMSEHNNYLLDGYLGVFWDDVVHGLKGAYQRIGKTMNFVSIEEALLPFQDIEKLVEPFVGKDDPIFGYKTNLGLVDFFDVEKIQAIAEAYQDGNCVIYGCGAALCSWDVPTVYIDLPKNVIQQRMRAGLVNNLGALKNADNKQIYKRFYFVDWVVLNKHKEHLLHNVDIMADQQAATDITWMDGSALRHTLKEMSTSYFRVLPWFEPGVWGGQWMKEHFHQLDQQKPNYAWSFEMIVPENGLVLEFNGIKLEISFDQLMFMQAKNVLGKAYNRFKEEFPIRFDFLDTFDGGNLSVQCHPTTAYIKEQFGENFTQDETYYIVDCKGDASVYLGFQENIDAPSFKAALEQSFQENKILDVEQYIQKFPANKHELYLIPNGTVHCSGKDNLVLEISATPYIFTFKMYDWLRPDLDGKPRPLNIDRAFDNIDFSRKGKAVTDTLIAKPSAKTIDENTELIHLPTHPLHFYDVYRYEFDYEVSILTNGQCQVLMLVEGESIELLTSNGHRAVFNFAETFAIPAATIGYKLKNIGKGTAKVVVAFVKEEAC